MTRRRRAQDSLGAEGTGGEGGATRRRTPPVRRPRRRVGGALAMIHNLERQWRAIMKPVIRLIPAAISVLFAGLALLAIAPSLAEAVKEEKCDRHDDTPISVSVLATFSPCWHPCAVQQGMARGHLGPSQHQRWAWLTCGGVCPLGSLRKNRAGRIVHRLRHFSQPAHRPNSEDGLFRRRRRGRDWAGREHVRVPWRLPGRPGPPNGSVARHLCGATGRRRRGAVLVAKRHSDSGNDHHRGPQAVGCR